MKNSVYSAIYLCRDTKYVIISKYVQPVTTVLSMTAFTEKVNFVIQCIFVFSVHAFVGSVALAGAEGELWSIQGGNHMLTEKLLVSSKAGLIQEKV